MHELGTAQNIVSLVAEYAQGTKVQRVLLEVGKLSAVTPESIQYCFDICAKDTVLEGAKLEILEISGLARCCQCGAELILENSGDRCKCGSAQLNLIAGQELRIKEIEVS